jgi:hypothetical protein
MDFNKALEEFGLDKTMFDLMDKSDLEVFVKTILGSNPSKTKQVYSRILLENVNRNTKKKVRICEPFKMSSKKLGSKVRTRSSSIENCGITPISQSIDVLFSSLVTCNSINTFL